MGWVEFLVKIEGYWLLVTGYWLKPVASCQLPVAGYFARTVIPAKAGIPGLGALSFRRKPESPASGTTYHIIYICNQESGMEKNRKIFFVIIIGINASYLCELESQNF
jgi:hypothetical protein